MVVSEKPKVAGRVNKPQLKPPGIWLMICFYDLFPFGTSRVFAMPVTAESGEVIADAYHTWVISFLLVHRWLQQLSYVALETVFVCSYSTLWKEACHTELKLGFWNQSQKYIDS